MPSQLPRSIRKIVEFFEAHNMTGPQIVGVFEKLWVLRNTQHDRGFSKRKRNVRALDREGWRGGKLFRRRTASCRGSRAVARSMMWPANTRAPDCPLPFDTACRVWLNRRRCCARRGGVIVLETVRVIVPRGNPPLFVCSLLRGPRAFRAHASPPILWLARRAGTYPRRRAQPGPQRPGW